MFKAALDYTHEELTQAKKQEARADSLACQSQDSAQTPQNPSQARENEQPSEEKRDRPTPYGDVDIDDSSRYMAEAEGE